MADSTRREGLAVSTVADQYRLILTEARYTTAEGPFAKPAAMAAFTAWSAGCGPTSGSSLRMVTEHEYQRIWPELERRNEAADELVTFARREHVGGHVDAIRYTGRNATTVAAAFGARAVRSRWTHRLDITFSDDSVIPVPRGWWVGLRHLDGEFLVSAPRTFQDHYVEIDSIEMHQSLSEG